MDTNILAMAGYALLGYGLGSIPFGLLLTRIAGAGDLQAIGSGNIGATNVLRTGRRWLAVLTLLLDGAKGALAVAIAGSFGDAAGLGAEHAMLVAGAAGLIGHCYPIWLGGRGGKGVATFLGVSIALAWPLGVVFVVSWIVVAVLFRFSSLAGIVASLAVPIAAWSAPHVGFGKANWSGAAVENFAIGLAALVVLIVYRHRANIQRLLSGSEPRIGDSKPQAQTDTETATTADSNS